MEMQYSESLKVKERHKTELLDRSITEVVEAQAIQRPNVVGVRIGRPIIKGKKVRKKEGIESFYRSFSIVYDEKLFDNKKTRKVYPITVKLWL